MCEPNGVFLRLEPVIKLERVIGVDAFTLAVVILEKFGVLRCGLGLFGAGDLVWEVFYVFTGGAVPTVFELERVRMVFVLRVLLPKVVQ